MLKTQTNELAIGFKTKTSEKKHQNIIPTIVPYLNSINIKTIACLTISV